MSWHRRTSSPKKDRDLLDEVEEVMRVHARTLYLRGVLWRLVGAALGIPTIVVAAIASAAHVAAAFLCLLILMPAAWVLTGRGDYRWMERIIDVDKTWLGEKVLDWHRRTFTPPPDQPSSARPDQPDPAHPGHPVRGSSGGEP